MRVQFETRVGGAKVTALEMASNFEVPELKKQLSARVRSSTHAKLLNIRDLWRVAVRETTDKKPGETEQEYAERLDATVEAIDLTHVLDVLLASACDDELQQWGGYTETAEKRANQLKMVRERPSSTPAKKK
jgi:hypothetical protein